MIFFRSLYLIAGLVVLTACEFTKGKQAATKSVNVFHQQYNAERFSEIYQKAAPSFQSATTELKFLELMKGVRNKFGPMTKTSQSGWRTNATTSGTFVLLVHDTEFERGSAKESFTFAVSGEHALLQGYNVSSPDFFTSPNPAAPAPQFASAEAAQQEAVRRYPEIGRAGSPLNREFVARHKRIQQEHPEALQDPSWPLRIAEESAKALGK